MLPERGSVAESDGVGKEKCCGTIAETLLQDGESRVAQARPAREKKIHTRASPAGRRNKNPHAAPGWLTGAWAGALGPGPFGGPNVAKMSTKCANTVT